MEQMLSEKNKTLIIIEKATFRKGRILVSSHTHWRCTIKNCKAKFYTINEKDIIDRDLIHNHDIDSAKLCREKISNNLKRKAEEEISVTPLKVIHKKIKETPEVLQELTLVDIGYIRKNLYNARRAYFPPLPKSVQDVQDALDSMSIKTIQEESFLITNDRENNIVIFSCITNLNFLNSVEVIYVDGTFQYCPKFFYQLFTLHGFKNGQYVPAVFALLPSKATSTYVKLFSTIQMECSKFELTLNPKKIVVDFEDGIHSALYTVFPVSEIEGCIFHLKQGWYRKILQLGLSVEIRNQKSEVGKWLKHLFGLPYLQLEQVSDMFCFEMMAEKPEGDAITKFADYSIITYKYR